MFNLTNPKRYGNLEKVFIRESHNGVVAVGTLESGNRIFVNNASIYLKSEIIAKVDFQYKGDATGNFITDIIPEYFHSLHSEDYILLGLWDEDMFKKSRYPTIDEINKYFEPGKMGSVIYAANESDEKLINGVKISGFRTEKVEFPQFTLVEQLPKPKYNSRTVIVESQKMREYFLDQFLFAVPKFIEMQRLK